MNFDSPSECPVSSAQKWFDEAVAQNETQNPLAAALSTVDASNRPSARMVLLKGFDSSGAVFYTNYNSPKGIDLQANKNASLLFHWDYCKRQLRIRGSVCKLTVEESDTYFATRPKLSQVGTWASHQSQKLTSRTELTAKADDLMAKWANSPVPRPEHWGGYRVSLDEMEFWYERDGRLHDRVRYSTEDDQWTRERLQP